MNFARTSTEKHEPKALNMQMMQCNTKIQMIDGIGEYGMYCGCALYFVFCIIYVRIVLILIYTATHGL